MIFCSHRVNTIKQLKQIPTNFGIEIDVNIYQDNLVLKHDPFGTGDLLKNFLNFFNHNFLIINVKIEGIEKNILNYLNKRKIKNFFFLDSSFPNIFKLSKKLTKKFALRISDFESVETAYKMKNKIEWIWIDCFNNYNISVKEIKKLQKLKYKLCLVSPELHKRKISLKDKLFFKRLNKNNIKLDMICAKKKNYQIILKFFPYLHT
jgi:hypothetical protein